MPSDAVWEELIERCTGLDADEYLVTPSSGAAFTITRTGPDRIVVEFRDTQEERTLWRDQFAVLIDRLDGDGTGLSIDDLPAGVEPYVSVLSLSPAYVVDGTADVMRPASEDESQASPFLRDAWEVRTTPERVRDDSLLLADVLDRQPLEDIASASPDSLVDLYVLLSDVQRGADRFRRSVGDRLLEYIGPDARLHGRYGTVTRTHRSRRHLKDADEIFDVLDRYDVPREWVIGVDREKLDVVIAATDVDEDEVYDVTEQVYVQKTDVEEEEKQGRLQGLKDRLARLETAEAEDLKDEIDRLETRLDDMLAAS